jgi:hypothetical protein
MRALTDAEAKTIAVLLGSAAAPERERLARSGLPRSTYHAARRRAYLEGWLRDRYVPEPERFGFPFAVFLVARPFADRLDALLKLWSGDPGVVALWGGPGAVLGTFLRPSAEAARSLAQSDAWRSLVSTSIPVVADLRGPNVPVYYDFEGLWAHLAGISGTVAYPRGLGGSSPATDGEAERLTDHQRWAASELLARPFDANGTSLRLVGPLGLPFSQQRLVARGWVNHRVFLDPSRLASYRGSAADLYVFIAGTPREGLRPELLFQRLVRESRVFPFLYALSPERLLIGALGSSTPQAGPSGKGEEVGRRPVMATLNESITGIELWQEPTGALPALIDHRYDRLLPRRV